VSGPQCVCGHDRSSHIMNWQTHRLEGRCTRGHYGPYGRWQDAGCECRAFTPAASVSDLESRKAQS
jgi:hypothetical protein